MDNLAGFFQILCPPVVELGLFCHKVYFLRKNFISGENPKKLESAREKRNNCYGRVYEKMECGGGRRLSGPFVVRDTRTPGTTENLDGKWVDFVCLHIGKIRQLNS